MENPMLDFEMEHSEKLKKAFFEGYEAGKKDAEFYMLHCGDTDEPETNADRIRAMTDEELAKLLNEFGDPYYCPADNGRWIDWLKQECES